MFNYYYLAIKHLLKNRMPQDWQPTDLNLFTGQLEETEDGELLYTTPCTLIEFEPIVWQNWQQGLQRGDLRFNIHIIDETNYEGETRIIAAEIDHYERVNQHYKALQGVTFVCLSELQGFHQLQGTENDAMLIQTINRIQSIPDHSIAPYLHTVLQFQATCYDYTTKVDWIELTAQFVVNAEISLNPI